MSLRRVRLDCLGLDLLEESEAYLAELRAARATPIHQRDIQMHRESGPRITESPLDAGGAVTARSVSVGSRTVDIRQYLPSGPMRGGYLHFHGGGWVFGSAAAHDADLSELSEDLSIAVFSVEYRLAPEHPFPAALDDAETAAHWLMTDGRREFGLGLTAIGGASAGAHLAALTLQRLAVEGEAGAFCAASLVYGIFDLSMTPSQRLADDTPRLTRADLEWYYDKVMPGACAEARRDATVSPLFGDLRGMPPARFAVGSLDPLFDDSVFMAARWAAAGSPASLEVYSAAAHGFAQQGNGLGTLARLREHSFLARHLGIDKKREARI